MSGVLCSDLHCSCSGTFSIKSTPWTRSLPRPEMRSKVKGSRHIYRAVN